MSFRPTPEALHVLVVGGGGREHALAWACGRSPLVRGVSCAPGNAGTAEIGANHQVAPTDAQALLGLVKREAVDLVLLGPDAAVAAGVADELRDAEVPVFGAGREAGRLETSKAFAKGVMDQAGVRTAPWAAFRDHAEALAHLRRRGAPVVVKADGLALGKGAFVCATEEEAEGVLEALMVRRSLGGAGATVVIEDCLEGEEISLFALTDGDRVVMLPPARDYKRAWVKDQGPNTGGMGAFAPAPESDWAGVNRRAREEVVEPVLREMRRRGTPFQGCLYVGGILTAQGLKVLEFNARFGDPEAEVLLPLLPDPVPLFWQTARGGLEPQDLGAPSGFCLGVVAVRRPYPEPIEGGGEISGLETAAELGCQVFQMGTRVGPSSRPEVSGGRVLICTATGGGLESARQLAYSGIEAVSFAGMSYRPDIGA